MKNIIFLLLFTFSSSVLFSQVSLTTRNGALRNASQEGNINSVKGALNYTDEIRKEVGGTWNFRSTNDADTVTLVSFPGSTTLTSGTSFYNVDVLLKSYIASDTATGNYVFQIDSTSLTVSVSAVLNPYIRLSGYVYRRSGGQHSYSIDAHITNTTTDAVTVKHFSGDFTRSSGAVWLKFWPVNLAEADSFQVVTKAALLRK